MKKNKIRPGLKNKNNTVFLKAFKKEVKHKLNRTWQITK